MSIIKKGNVSPIVKEGDTYKRPKATVPNPHLPTKKKDMIFVHVRGGCAYCDDNRVKIIDHDNH